MVTAGQQGDRSDRSAPEEPPTEQAILQPAAGPPPSGSAQAPVAAADNQDSAAQKPPTDPPAPMDSPAELPEGSSSDRQAQGARGDALQPEMPQPDHPQMSANEPANHASGARHRGRAAEWWMSRSCVAADESVADRNAHDCRAGVVREQATGARGWIPEPSPRPGLVQPLSTPPAALAPGDASPQHRPTRANTMESRRHCGHGPPSEVQRAGRNRISVTTATDQNEQALMKSD